MIFRILIILAILFFGLYLIQGNQLRKIKERQGRQSLKPTNLVKCHYCQVYISEQEACSAGGLHYCSEEHKNRARQVNSND